MPFGSTSWRRLLGCWWLPKSFFGCAAALASAVPNSIMLMTNAVFFCQGTPQVDSKKATKHETAPAAP